MRFWETVNKGLVDLDSNTDIVAPIDITEDFIKMTLDQFKNQVFKNFAARHQVNHLRPCKTKG